MNVDFLKIPLYKLYFIEDLKSFSRFSKEDLESFKREYNEFEIKAINDSLTWVRQYPTYNFLSLLPNLRHKNADIYKYLCKLEIVFNRSS